jgi:hypothetical protein
VATDSVDALAALGREAFERGDAEASRHAFEAALVERESGELLEGADEASAEHGWVELARAAREPHGDDRERRLRAALALGREAGDAELQFAAVALLGESLVLVGRIEEGMLLFDESLAAVCGGAGDRACPVGGSETAQGRLEEAAILLEGLDQMPDAARALAALHLARGETAVARDLLAAAHDADAAFATRAAEQRPGSD